jgi:hypothetical protein
VSSQSPPSSHEPAGGLSARGLSQPPRVAVAVSRSSRRDRRTPRVRWGMRRYTPPCSDVPAIPGPKMIISVPVRNGRCVCRSAAGGTVAACRSGRPAVGQRVCSARRQYSTRSMPERIPTPHDHLPHPFQNVPVGQSRGRQAGACRCRRTNCRSNGGVACARVHPPRVLPAPPHTIIVRLPVQTAGMSLRVRRHIRSRRWSASNYRSPDRTVLRRGEGSALIGPSPHPIISRIPTTQPRGVGIPRGARDVLASDGRRGPRIVRRLVSALRR